MRVLWCVGALLVILAVADSSVNMEPRASHPPYYPFNNCDTRDQVEWDFVFEVNVFFWPTVS